MKNFTRILFFTLFLGTFAAKAGAGNIVTDSLRSNILDTTLKFNVFLPDGFENGEKSYPVVYLLHGLTDDHLAWRERGLMRYAANQMLRSGEIREMIIVMPAAGCEDTRDHWNGYFNMPGWRYEEYFFQELIPEVERRYRVISDKEHRAVMGLSMGGGASVVYCQRHPDMFSSCFAMSPWLENKSSQVGGEDPDPGKFRFLSDAVNEFSALDFLDNADEATIQRLKSVKWFIDCGDDDYLMDLSVALYTKMRNSHIKCELRIRDGRHDWEYWHRSLYLALPFASRNFGCGR